MAMAVGIVVMLAATGAVACGHGAQAGEPTANTPPLPPTAAKRATLRQLADTAASGMGVENPSDVRVFATTFGTANMALRGASSAPPRIGEQIYLVTMRGGVFVAHDVPRPPGTSAPTGRMVALFVDPESDMVKAALLSNRIRDLSALGESTPLDR
jgi:hypothetical protein